MTYLEHRTQPGKALSHFFFRRLHRMQTVDDSMGFSNSDGSIFHPVLFEDSDVESEVYKADVPFPGQYRETEDVSPR